MANKDKTILIFSIAVTLLMIVNLILFLKLTRLEKQINEFLTPPEEIGIKLGEKVPNFNLFDIEEKEISLIDFKENSTLLIFTLTSCSPCIDLYDDIKEFENKYKEINVAMITNGSLEDNKKISEENNYSFPVLSDKEGLTINNYKVNGFPTALLIDKNNILINSGIVNDFNQLEDLLNINK